MSENEIALTLLRWNNKFLPHGFIASLVDFKEKEVIIRKDSKVSRAYRYLIKKAIRRETDTTCCYKYITRMLIWIGYYQEDDDENELKIITTKGYSVLFKIQQDGSIKITYYSLIVE